MTTSLTHLEYFKEITIDDPVLSNLERLRLFCSICMSNQDWLDSEEFFDAIEQDIREGIKCEC